MPFRLSSTSSIDIDAPFVLGDFADIDDARVRAAVGSPDRLAALAATGLMDTAPEPTFDELAELAAQCADAPRSCVAFVAADRQFFKSAIGMPADVAQARGIPLSHSLCRFVVAAGAPIAVRDARVHPLTCDNGAVRDLGVVAFAGSPICAPSGEVLGAVAVYDVEPREWDHETMIALEHIAHAAATAVTLRRRVVDLERADRERESATAALRESEQRFRALVEQSAEAVFVLDQRARFTYVSPSADRVLGHPTHALSERTAFDLVHPDDVARCMDALHATFAEPGEVHTARIRARHADATYRTIEMSARALHGDGDRSAMVCARDVTEHENALEALRRSEELFRALTTSSPVGVFLCDTEGKALFGNDRVAEIWQRPLADLLGAGYVSAVHPDDVEHLFAAYQQNMTLGTVYEVDYRVVRPDGSVRFTTSRGSPFADANGNVAGVIGIIVDVTERRRVEDALAESEVRLREALDAARMVAWEIDMRMRTISTAISPTAQWVTAKGFATGDFTESFDTFLARVNAEDGARLEAAILEAVRSEGQIDAEFRLEDGDGRTLWRHAKGRAVRGQDGEVTRLVGVTLDITPRKMLEAELTQRTLHDALTGLANRVGFRQRVVQTLDDTALDLAMTHRPAVLFLDLDDFKTVNDSLGHDAGDELLKQVARRLTAATRGTDTVARLGGDEFAILIEKARTPNDAAIVADRVVAALGTPFVIAKRTLNIGGSVGIAFADADDCADDLLRNADVAMYHAKASGKSQWAAFTPAMHAAALQRLENEAELRQAIENDELKLYYQPIIDVATGAVTGAEALARWEHPTRGLISIGPYIPLAESTELIVPMGRKALFDACRDAAAWTAPEGDALPTVAVNVSGRQLLRGGFVDDVAAALRESGLAPHRLTLEVTESVLLADIDLAIRELEALRALGVRLALDDFGTGYSSLSYLHRLPVDILKIDRSFIANVATGGRRAALASAIVAVATSLGLETVAEGVETEAQHVALQALACPLAQGFLYAHALPPAEFEAFRRGRPAPKRAGDDATPAWRGLRPTPAAAAAPTTRAVRRSPACVAPRRVA